MTTIVLSASVTKASDTNTQGSLHQRDPILVAYIRVSLVQGSMLLQLNAVIVAFLINFDKKNSQPVVFSYIDSQPISFKENIFTKGPSIYYVIQIWGPERPPPPPCNIVINREDPPPL